MDLLYIHFQDSKNNPALLHHNLIHKINSAGKIADVSATRPFLIFYVDYLEIGS
ncbi:hypothetical protein EM20IM_02330 [Candidatus Methylacidiphilum infernorum]|uniref:Uncharacterized protein n=1 Tax=Candidatus Methylacidiphilum infernorum TaxID=511746 RepID=A0ABX7PW23_9BACT|nr:hypothetical protein [Candidatus Methylacidiphilum infernorum]QSR87199.1 hypothetical protein EM20IM_02330 [Candidatus Methylacidiphilum infernorum]